MLTLLCLSHYPASLQSSIEELGLREFASLFRMSKNLGTANLTSRSALLDTFTKQQYFAL